MLRDKNKDLARHYDKIRYTNAWQKKRKSTTQKTYQKQTITQRLQIDLGRSGGEMTATQLVWLNRLTGSQPSHWPQNLCNQDNAYFKICKYTQQKF